MHHCSVCAKTLDYLQQVHLWIISCFKIAPSPPTCTNTEGLRTAQVVGQCSSKAEDGRMRRRDAVRRLTASVKLVSLLCFLLAAIYWLGVVQQGLASLSFLHQLDAAVGHEQHGEGGQWET